jgi:WXXGXW repeat (2 copies)
MYKKTLLCSLLFLLCFFAFAGTSSAQVAIGVSVGFAPPPIPVYDQPPCPQDGWFWTPGYWDWDGDDYYWVPGTWVEPPQVGYLWTPGWWGWGGSAFLWHGGYWGSEIGWYGGINYGFGYFGHGYEGGRWDGGHFFYNRAVTNINVSVIHNTYNTRIENINNNRVSYNGHGGIDARPSAREEAFSRENHVEAVAGQRQQREEARGNRDLRASVNQGRPAIAATARPGSFNDRGSVVAAREAGGKYEAPANRGGATPGGAPAANRPTYGHAKELNPHTMTAPNTGNAKTDQKYQQQQQKLAAQQDKDHQKLVQQQEKDHTKLDRQKANDNVRQQVEQRHQTQTQNLEQRHTQQTQHMEQRQAPPAQHGGGGRPR